MNAACVRTMFRVQKERDRMALETPPAPELHDLVGDPEPMTPNSTFTPDDQAILVEHICGTACLRIPASVLPYKHDAYIAWRLIRQTVFARDSFRCAYCQRKCGPNSRFTHCDHIIPICQGGTDDLANLTTACASCNLKKSGQTPDQWHAYQDTFPARAAVRAAALSVAATKVERRTKRRQSAMRVPCLTCEADRNRVCVGKTGAPRKSCHKDRHTAARVANK